MGNYRFEVEYREGKFHFFVNGASWSSDDPDDCKREMGEWTAKIVKMSYCRFVRSYCKREMGEWTAKIWGRR